MGTNFERARVWILMAISDLERVIRNFESEDFAAAVFRAQTSAERLSKGLIFLFGLQFKKTYKPTAIIKKVLGERQLTETQKKLVSQIISKAKILEEQGTIPRYGVETPTTILRPEELYDKNKTLELIRVASELVDVYIRLLELQNLFPDVQPELRRVKVELSKLFPN